MSPLRVLHSLFELAVSPVHSNPVAPTHTKLQCFNIQLEELEFHLMQLSPFTLSLQSKRK